MRVFWINGDLYVPVTSKASQQTILTPIKHGQTLYSNKLYNHRVITSNLFDFQDLVSSLELIECVLLVGLVKLLVRFSLGMAPFAQVT